MRNPWLTHGGIDRDVAEIENLLTQPTKIEPNRRVTAGLKHPISAKDQERIAGAVPIDRCPQPTTSEHWSVKVGGHVDETLGFGTVTEAEPNVRIPVGTHDQVQADPVALLGYEGGIAAGQQAHRPSGDDEAENQPTYQVWRSPLACCRPQRRPPVQPILNIGSATLHSSGRCHTRPGKFITSSPARIGRSARPSSHRTRSPVTVHGRQLSSRNTSISNELSEMDISKTPDRSVEIIDTSSRLHTPGIAETRTGRS